MTADQHLATIKRAYRKRARADIRRGDAESELTQAIVRASVAGVPYRTIAKVADLSHQRIAQIVQANRDGDEVGKP